MPKILVVEDDGDLSYLYGTVLTRHGYSVESARRGADALLHLTNEPFDLIILDIGMPDMSGLRVLEFVREDARLKQIPVVVASANEQNERLARTRGAQHFLVKPVKLQKLVALVEHLLGPEPERHT
ncbi:MAG TPA: response regulator [Aggregatilinea sp.]|uniref:response regulator n=1 Tax=Aggregatilinea sp. TaxID=2806333 RepID=UPI002B7457BA|nr:response regulator [Aggregatilinea sp.]HML24662.1 response regulator [Aggregatilinea sp.]